MTLRARIVMGVLVIGAVAGFGWSFTLFSEHTSTPTVRDSAIKSFQPTTGSNVLRQTLIAYELDPAYSGVLFVDGTEIPPEELEPTALTNQIGYTPAKEKITGILKTGKHTATAEFWPRDKTRSDSRSFTWSFFVT
ncbi:MAG TPA: hypothetical protein VFA83_24015 [Acidimicrobiales bacterium]|nr:hypothetical protein [Acidimicrobiales bacterium]